MKIHKRIFIEVKRDFQPLVRFIESAEVRRGKENVFDEPVVGDFAKYTVPRAEIGLYKEASRELRKILFEMIAEALKIKINEISELDFEMKPRDPSIIMMDLLLGDGTEITIPLIDRSATKEE